MLEESEMESIEYFSSHVEDLEQQEDWMTESSNKTIGSCGFKFDNLCVITGFAGDNPSFGDILNEAKSCKIRYDDEWFVDEDKDEFL